MSKISNFASPVKEVSYVFPISEEGKSTNKRVQVHKFKGKVLIDIRETYQNQEGEWCPSKKGISLTVDQFEKLKELLPLIEEATEELQK